MINFVGQQTNEKILLLGHKHWLITLYKTIKMLIVISLLSLAIGFIFQAFGSANLPLFIFIVGLILLGHSLFIYFQHKHTFLLITNQRVMLSIQRGLFSNKTRSANLNKISETAFNLNGVFGSIFGFGKLIIQSDVPSPENRQMTFENLSNVKDSKFFLDKLITLVDEGTPHHQLPIFIQAKKGKRY